ncbi:cupin domain-containing protein [Mycobacterium sp. 236(2023)]|uniref:cupin domain-containing protein n=1 Tax=Mycobacterium sp. 236(2023) TaxID=3038163 RepID=UPI00241547B0|nr:cupin domain-containing protein [Mycobacterium sp. 236(2023)]MDG4667705.1 cupin domain-containing protein [Mycobacterium sp. 236(2023)]
MLGRCVASDPGAFATEYWGRKPLLSRHTALPRDFSDLLSSSAVDELIAERGVRAPFIRMAKTGNVLARSCYTGPAGFGAEMPDQVDSAKVLSEFAAGASIVLQGLHRLWPPVIDFVRGLTDELGHPVQANAYITPPDAQGFEAHYDVHDVFVLQVAGEKRWTVHQPVYHHPLASQPWTDHRDAIAARIDDDPVIDTVLTPGDALYLPRGWVHSARSLDTTSIHLTIGVSAVTYLDVVRTVVDTLAADEDFRKSLPMGIDATDRGEMASTASKVMAQLADVVRDRTADLSDKAAAHLSDRHVDRTRPVGVRPLATLDAIEAAGALRVQWRHGLVGTVEHLGGQVRLRLPDRTITFPDSCAAAVAELQRGVVADAQTLPGLDHADSTVLIRRLLREAVVVAVEGGTAQG